MRYVKGTKVKHIKTGVIETIVGIAKMKIDGEWVEAVIYKGKDRYTNMETTFVKSKIDFENEFKEVEPMVERDMFKYRPVFDDNLDIIVYTTPIDCCKHNITIDKAEDYIVKQIETGEWKNKYRSIIADKLRDIADSIEYNEKKLDGFIADYDSFEISAKMPYHEVNWEEIDNGE